MSIKQQLRELLKGEAMYPEARDIRHPLKVRIRKGRMVLVYVYSSGVFLQLLEIKASKDIQVLQEKRIGNKEDAELDEALSLIVARYRVRYAIWVYDHGWEIQVSRMCWERSYRELQNEFLEGRSPLPREEVEGFMEYSPVLQSVFQKTWLFSIHKKMVIQAEETCQKVGLELVRTCIGMACYYRYLAAHDIAERLPESSFILIETEGGMLLLENREVLLHPVGQWASMKGNSEDQEKFQEVLQRLSGELPEIILFSSKGNEGVGSFLKKAGGVKVHPVYCPFMDSVLWDPPNDIQPDLSFKTRGIRPFLPPSMIFIRWVMILLIPLSLLWIGKQHRDSAGLQASIILKHKQREDIRYALEKEESQRKELELGKEKVDRIIKWIRQVIPSPVLITEVLQFIPEGVRVETLSMRSSEGQRQVEVSIQHPGRFSSENDLYSLLMTYSQAGAWDMISYEQPSVGNGNRTKVVFMNPVVP